MRTWVELRDQIRRSILKDTDPDVSKRQWSDDTLRDGMWWALNALCAHTAYATATAYVCDGTTTTYTLPSNVFTPLEDGGMVYLDDGTNLVHLNPVFNTNGVSPIDGSGFYTWNDQLTITATTASGETLRVRFFAYYPLPINDNDLVMVPHWAEAAVCYLAAAHALEGSAQRRAKIAQWGQKPDLGDTEDNPFRVQVDMLLKMYQTEINRHPQQKRANFFRASL